MKYFQSIRAMASRDTTLEEPVRYVQRYENDAAELENIICMGATVSVIYEPFCGFNLRSNSSSRMAFCTSLSRHSKTGIVSQGIAIRAHIC